MTSTIKLNATNGGGSIALKGVANTAHDVELTMPSDIGTANQYLKLTSISGKTGTLAWSTVSSTPEGTAILSTGESGGTKFLREDGDNSCSWQAVPAPSITTTSGTDNFTVADGNLVIGTSGHGIDFSATSDGSGTDSSELLDDYEEGTFTPVYKTSNDDGGHSMGTQSGHYRKVGSLVTFTSQMTWSGGSGGSGYCFMEGLPYAPGGSTFWLTLITVDGYTCSTNRYLSGGEIHSSQDKVIIKEMNNSGGGSNYNAPYDGSVGGTLLLCGSYTTSS